MARVPGAIGKGYLPKGGAKVALAMAAEADRVKALAAAVAEQPYLPDAVVVAAPGAPSGGTASASGPEVVVERSGARSRAGRVASTEGLALTGAVAGVLALLADLARVVF